MIIEIIFPGKTKEKYLAVGIADFEKRVGRYAEVRLRAVRTRKEAGNASVAALMEEEGRELLSHVSPNGMVVALDRRGEPLDSEELAALIRKWRDEGRRIISFVLGGQNGLSESLLKDASFILSLSRMTLTHEMARLFLLEQIYRAFTIMAGTGYHK